MAKIVVIGSLNMDLVATAPRLPLAGETIIGAEFINEPGGKGANQAFAAAKLGGDVAIFGRVGADNYGRRLTDNLRSSGCDVSRVGTADVSSGVALIMVAETGQNSIVVVPGANHRYLPSDLAIDARELASAQMVLLQLETPLDTVIAAAKAARAHHVQVILDPAPAQADLPTELLRNVDILTPNETEALQLLGRAPAAIGLDEAPSIAAQLRSLGLSTVILKLGAQGCLLAQGDAVTHIPAPRVQAVDTTAAGDIFNAALAVARSEGTSLSDACRFAVRAAALSVTRLGAQRSSPSRLELATFDADRS